jgi:hypothetical protein
VEKVKTYCLFCVVTIMFSAASYGQKYETEVLLLNIAKYESMRETVKEVKDTYEILSKWYGKIEDVATGDLKLHSVFLDELKTVSPTVLKYYKIGEIVKKEKVMIDHYSNFFGFVRNSENFNEKEVTYLKNLFNKLLNESGDHMEQLFMVITASDLNMSDQERIKVIDKLSDNIDGQLSFLTDLNNQIFTISAYKDKEKKEIREFEIYNGVNKD